ncbi:hypothetical protein [Hymenobacter sp. IS2118]|uniref:hypothetical protein n=1 Tax=Hymenobacter sp. IS2118 TaxID=1505605 RepID=UPI000B0C9B88|nr:hypothetical protein [Hymenobacter sp. IS2118]
MAKKISPGDLSDRNHPDWSRKIKGAVPPPRDIINPPPPPAPANTPAPANDQRKDS